MLDESGDAGVLEMSNSSTDTSVVLKKEGGAKIDFREAPEINGCEVVAHIGGNYSIDTKKIELISFLDLDIADISFVARIDIEGFNLSFDIIMYNCLLFSLILYW